MADNTPSWAELISAFIAYPEKSALILVLVAGAWRLIRELWRETKDDSHHESLVETLMREQRELREENKRLRNELRDERKNSDQ